MAWWPFSQAKRCRQCQVRPPQDGVLSFSLGHANLPSTSSTQNMPWDCKVVTLWMNLGYINTTKSIFELSNRKNPPLPLRPVVCVLSARLLPTGSNFFSEYSWWWAWKSWLRRFADRVIFKSWLMLIYGVQLHRHKTRVLISVDTRLTACPGTLQLTRFSFPRTHMGE